MGRLFGSLYYQQGLARWLTDVHTTCCASVHWQAGLAIGHCFAASPSFGMFNCFCARPMSTVCDLG